MLEILETLLSWVQPAETGVQLNFLLYLSDDTHFRLLRWCWVAIIPAISAVNLLLCDSVMSSLAVDNYWTNLTHDPPVT